jgi:hypothetical protein
MKRYLLSLPMLLFLFGCATVFEEARRPAEFPLPYVITEMKEADFWIDRISSPDEIIMTESEIEEFNRKNLDIEVYLDDIAGFPETLGGDEVREKISPLVDWSSSRAFFGHDNYILPPDFYTGMKRLIDLDSVPDKVDVRWGIITRETDLRVIPTVEIGMEQESDYEFDHFQMSFLAAATPVVVIWATIDSSWLFVVTPYASGWVASSDVAISESKDKIFDYLNREPFLVVFGPGADVYSESDRGHYACRLRLGARVPLLDDRGNLFEVEIPIREFDGSVKFMRGYISESAPVSRGYPPYTPENILIVAFSMMGRRYGWGGMWGYWDCSAFVRDVFSVFGFNLPRNSTSQAKVGVPLGRFEAKTPIDEKLKIIDNASPAVTLLRLPGHVMIYLGEYEGRYYVIHDSWAYRSRASLWRSELVGIGRVVVSELNLGRGGKKGSLIERIRDVVEIR